MSDWVSREKGQVIPVILPATHCLIWLCEEPIERAGYCKAHLGEWEAGRRNGPKPRVRKLCSADDCGSQAHAKGMCKRHYNLAYGAARRERGRGNCEQPGCAEPAHGRGFCLKHYNQRREQFGVAVSNGGGVW